MMLSGIPMMPRPLVNRTGDRVAVVYSLKKDFADMDATRMTQGSPHCRYQTVCQPMMASACW